MRMNIERGLKKETGGEPSPCLIIPFGQREVLVSFFGATRFRAGSRRSAVESHGALGRSCLRLVASDQTDGGFDSAVFSHEIPGRTHWFGRKGDDHNKSIEVQSDDRIWEG